MAAESEAVGQDVIGLGFTRDRLKLEAKELEYLNAAYECGEWSRKSGGSAPWAKCNPESDRIMRVRAWHNAALAGEERPSR